MAKLTKKPNEMISELLPQSQEWLIRKGYAKRAVEDNINVIQLTRSGYEYFARITSGGKNAVGNQTDSRRKAPKRSTRTD